jgi:heterodisulfide reductase subunit D
MAPGEGGALPAGWLLELVRAFGPDRVLTDYEDRYVYSFHGEFATRRRGLPDAVVRLLSESEWKKLDRLSGSLGFRVVRNDRPEEYGSERLDAPTVLLDAREPVDASALLRRLSGLEEARAEGRRALRDETPLPQWFVSSLQARDGFRIGELPDCDNGFCAVQRFFGGVETYSSKGRLTLTRGLLGGELEPTGRLADSIYNCTACGQCYDQLGLDGLEVNNAIVRARRELAEAGLEPRQAGLLADGILGEGNPMGMPAEDRTIWFEELAEEFPFRGDGVLYWAGCSTSYRLPGVVEATVRVLGEAGVGFGMLGTEEGCCGLILYLLGLWDKAGRNASKVSGMVQELGVERLVTGCAGCYYAFTRVYPTLGVAPAFEVLHTSQLMDELIREGRLHPKGLNRRVAWHDPCDLGRHCGVFEPPRRVLGSIPGLEPREPPLNRGHALCCGAGGGLLMYNEVLAEEVARSKVEEELCPLGVDAVVTGCPACILNLRNAARQLDGGPEVLDLSELVDRSL